MSLRILLLLASFAFFGAMALKQTTQKKNIVHLSKEAVIQSKSFMQCSPDWSLLDEDSLANSIGVLPGWGNYRWNIATKSDSALFYFNQGINLYYAFHIIESMASFKKAAQFDDNNAMIYWAQALAYGPNINDIEYKAAPEAYEAAQKAVALSKNCTSKEKALIAAMAIRYSTDSTVSRSSLNQLYTNKMQEAYLAKTNDADIGALYADAMMLQHPWEYWEHSGKAKPWTPKILTVLETVLKIAPNHPGANHYYIHSVEASKNPQRAIPSADRLGKLMPSVSHMIHMPSHIYIRSGNYKQGIKVNEMSVKGYNDYLALYPDVANNMALYLIHNLHMQSACAMMRANYAYSIKSADECRASFDTAFMSWPAPMGNFVQYVYMTPELTDVRYAKWSKILNDPAIPEHYVYANVLWHWARGMAFAKTGKMADAKKEQESMNTIAQHPDLKVVLSPFNSPYDAIKVAEKILAGTIAEEENKLNDAVKYFTEAAAVEDAMIYNEPKDWLIPAREYLGFVLLKQKSAVKAEKTFREDLVDNPNNFRALYGLYKALELQQKTTEAKKVKAQYQQAVEGKDINVDEVVF